jgi:hypothetical protein
MKSPSQVFENWFDDLPPKVQGEFALLFAMDVVQMFEDESLWGYDISIQRLKALLLRARQSRHEQKIMRIVADYFDERLEYWQPHSLVPASVQQFIQQHRLHTHGGIYLIRCSLWATGWFRITKPTCRPDGSSQTSATPSRDHPAAPEGRGLPPSSAVLTNLKRTRHFAAFVALP